MMRTLIGSVAFRPVARSCDSEGSKRDLKQMVAEGNFREELTKLEGDHD